MVGVVLPSPFLWASGSFLASTWWVLFCLFLSTLRCLVSFLCSFSCWGFQECDSMGLYFLCVLLFCTQVSPADCFVQIALASGNLHFCLHFQKHAQQQIPAMMSQWAAQWGLQVNPQAQPVWLWWRIDFIKDNHTCTAPRQILCLFLLIVLSLSCLKLLSTLEIVLSRSPQDLSILFSFYLNRAGYAATNEPWCNNC